MQELPTQGYLAGKYLDYQARYRKEMRKSDGTLLTLVREMLEQYFPGRTDIRLADIGCSTGNFLFHLRQAEPQLRLYGRDIYPEAIAACQAVPELSGIDFGIWDVREPSRERFDILVLNALLHFFKEEELCNVMANLADSLLPGGVLLAFAWLNPFEQEIHIREFSAAHPNGAILNIHSYALIARLLAKNGFEPPRFTPFQIPIDLPLSEDPGDLRTYTVQTLGGDRLHFRGAIFEPVCHVCVRKKP
jgi:SAM-dependent methyltransferase